MNVRYQHDGRYSVTCIGGVPREFLDSSNWRFNATGIAAFKQYANRLYECCMIIRKGEEPMLIKEAAVTWLSTRKRKTPKVKKKKKQGVA